MFRCIDVGLDHNPLVRDMHVILEKRYVFHWFHDYINDFREIHYYTYFRGLSVSELR